MTEGFKAGDRVIRRVGGLQMMTMTVTSVEGDLVHCGPWTFRRDTGGEVDEELGWDGLTVTGSVIELAEE